MEHFKQLADWEFITFVIIVGLWCFEFAFPVSVRSHFLPRLVLAFLLGFFAVTVLIKLIVG